MVDLVFFGGKGGVGKSTTSAATAAYLAKLKPEKKILLVSFDIAHNLSDIFNVEIGDKETKVLDNLWVIEPDADRYTEEFVKAFVEKAKELAYMAPLVRKITNLEQYIEESFSAASIPLAVKNSIFFEEIITKVGTYDLFIVDMPPTGNMISIFEIPKTTMQVFLKSTLETMDRVMEFMQTVRKFNPVYWFKPGSEKRRNVAKELVSMLRALDERGDKIMKLLKYNSSLRFVTIAERPSYEEIKRAAQIVSKYTKLDGVVINKIVPDGIDCRFCKKETEYQKKYISLIEDTFHGKKIWKGFKMEDEAIGLDKILEFARSIYQTESFDEIIHPRNE